MQETLNLIRTELTHSEEELLASLVDEGYTQSFGSAPGEPNPNPGLGYMIFKRRLSEFQNKLCTHPIVIKYIREKRTDDNDDILLALIDVILVSTVNLPVAKVVAITIRIGLKEICNSNKSEENS